MIIYQNFANIQTSHQNMIWWITLWSVLFTFLCFYFFNVKGGSVVTKGAQAAKNSSSTETKKKQPKEPGIKEGQPLPDNGSCKHYKKSHRWLRYV